MYIQHIFKDFGERFLFPTLNSKQKLNENDTIIKIKRYETVIVGYFYTIKIYKISPFNLDTVRS